MFDKFFRWLDNNKADRQEEGADMNDETRDNHYTHIHEGTIQSDKLTASDATFNHVEEGELVADTYEVNDWEVHDQITDDDNKDFSSNDDKPEFEHLLGRKNSGANVVWEGPQVEYVNRVLGIDSKEYTIETTRAVKSYQSKHGLTPTGRVNADLYNRL